MAVGKRILLIICLRNQKKWSEVTQLCPTLCDPVDCSLPRSSIHGIFPGQSSGVGCHFLLQRIFPTQGSNLGLPHCRQTPYHLSQEEPEEPVIIIWGTRGQIANTHWIIEKAREFQKNIYFCFIDYAKAFDCADHNKLWKILKEMGIPDHLTHLFRNLYAGQEATVRTGHGTTLVPNRKRSTSRLYIVTLLIYLTRRVHHEKRWAGRSTS